MSPVELVCLHERAEWIGGGYICLDCSERFELPAIPAPTDRTRIEVGDRSYATDSTDSLETILEAVCAELETPEDVTVSDDGESVTRTAVEQYAAIVEGLREEVAGADERIGGLWNEIAELEQEGREYESRIRILEADAVELERELSDARWEARNALEADPQS